MVLRIQLISETNLIRRGLLSLLDNKQGLNVVPQVICSPPSCYLTCRPSESDVIIMDTTSGKYSCIDCIRQVVKRHPSVKILVIIWEAHYTQTNEALNNGVKGVISMEADQSLLLHAIQIVAAGKQFIDPCLERAMAAKPYHNMINPFDILSPREKTVLQLILKGQNTSGCATRLNISKKTAANHYTQIKKKIAVNNLGQLTRLAIRHKLMNPI